MQRMLRLGAACVLVVGIAAACGQSVAPPPPVAAPAMTAAESAISRDLAVRLNQERAARGLPPVAADATLAARSAAWSRTMPGLAVPGKRLNHSDLSPLLGRYAAAAENIAWTHGGASGLIHTSWMRSDGHRHNMLAPNVDVVGIAVYCAPDGQMWVTETFGRTPGAGGPPGFGPLPPLAPISNPGTDGPTC
jgi:uncharacterized protein YkwD